MKNQVLISKTTHKTRLAAGEGVVGKLFVIFTTISGMFDARLFSLNFSPTALVAASARVITLKTTTIKG